MTYFNFHSMRQRLRFVEVPGAARPATAGPRVRSLAGGWACSAVHELLLTGLLSCQGTRAAVRSRRGDYPRTVQRRPE